MSQAEQKQQQLRLASGEWLFAGKAHWQVMPLRSHERCMLVCSKEADPSCSASTLSNEEYASLLDAAMRFPDKQVPVT